MRRRLLGLAAAKTVLGFGLGPFLLAAPRWAGASRVKSGAPGDAKPALTGMLRVPARVPAGQAVALSFTLHNPGTTSADVLVWGTPLEPRWFAPWVTVKRGSTSLTYGGAMVKRGDPLPANYLRIEPGQSHEAAIELGAAYDVAPPGRYRVLPQITLHDVIWGAPLGSARARDQHQPQPLSCPPLDFERLR